MLAIQKDQIINLKLKVENAEEAEKLLAWLYRERSPIKTEQYGCELLEINFGKDSKELLESLVEPFRQAVKDGLIQL